MLFKYRDEYQKIALDMLSLLPSMDRMDRLKAEFQWYQNDDSRELYLWRNNGENWTGLIGVEEDAKNVVVRLMVLTPGSASKANYCAMLDQLANNYNDKRIVSSLETVHFFREWQEENNEQS